jgi:hypothetical protein
MAITKNENTFSTTYKDDFSETDNYQRILFNSGNALQARELTQMQTIIQKQMERFGKNIFKDGSVVVPGGLNVDTDIEFVKLDQISFPAPVMYAGDILTESGTDIKARVIDFIAAEGSDPPTVFVDYIDAGSFSTGATAPRFSSSGTLTNGNQSGLGGTGGTVVTGSGVVGKGCRASVGNGAYFIRGLFVQTQPQTIIVSKYSNTPTTNVGFIITEDIVTVEDTTALYDNQNVLPNETAPGADRYRITLTLATDDSASVDSDTNFIVTNNLIAGVIQQPIDENTYSIIGDELALRTKEESGDYTVNAPIVFFTEKDADELTLDIDPITAYVDGYRVAKPQKTFIDVNKSQTTSSADSDQNVSVSYGHYVVADTIKGLPNVNEFEQWNLKAGAGATGLTLGTARIRSVIEDGARYRYHIFDIQMDSSLNFRDTVSIGADANNYADLVLENSNAVIKEANENNMFFDLPRIRPSSVNVNGLTVQRRLQETAAAGIIQFTFSNGEIATDATSWIITDTTDGSIVDQTPTLGGSPTGTTATYGSLTDGRVYEVLGFVARANITNRSKTLQTDGDDNIAPASIDSDGDGLRFFNLSNYDIYSFDSIADVNTGQSIASRFITDNGQRDNFYDVGRIILKSGQSIPSSNIRVYYKYFSHGATGDFFSVNSYNAQVDYEDIPKYRQRNGTSIELRNVLDFRSKKHTDGTFSGGSSFVHALPANTDVIRSTNTYYQSRKDILVANTEGEIVYIEGKPAESPLKPVVPDNALELVNFTLNPYTDDANDLSINYVDNRRYTMRDIGNIVKRIDNIEEAVTLSLLELETSTLEVLDANGNNRFKNGFFADNFKDFKFSDITGDGYLASIDLDENTINPFITQDNVRMEFKPGTTSFNGTSSNVVQRGDALMLSYSETAEINQNLATGIENVNPYDVIIYEGMLDLSPSVDQWITVERRRRRIQLQEGQNADTIRNRIRNSFIRPTQSELTPLEGTGFEGLDLRPGFNVGSTTVTTRLRTTQRRLSELAAGRFVTGVNLIPFIRSRKVFFRAQGLAPNREHFLYFDRTPIPNFVREEAAGFKFFADSSGIDVLTSGRDQNQTSHPDGSSQLTSDPNGTIIGSFFIPNNSSLKFETGSRDVSLLDTEVSSKADFSTASLASLSGASAEYRASGLNAELLGLEFVQPRPPRTRRRDPIAQSFQFQNDNGGFITSVEVYFATKPDSVNDNTPITLELRPLRSGVPSQDEILPGSQVTLNPIDVNVEPFTDTVTISEIRNNSTTFTFDTPIYLEGNTSYALVLLANTQAYNVYVADLTEFVVNDTNRRVTSQPTLGSFFSSQNTVTWTPNQFRDMMFKVNRADFASSGTAIFENFAIDDARLPVDPISTTSGDSDVRIFAMNSGFVVNDTVQITGVDSSTRYGGILGTSLLGARTITKVDGESFQFKADSAATQTIITGGSSVNSEVNILMDEMVPNMRLTLPYNGTTVGTTANLTTGASLVTANNVSNTAYGTLDAAGEEIDIEPFRLIRFNSPRVVANSRIEEAEFGQTHPGRKSVKYTSSLATGDTYVSPVIDLASLSMSTVSNIIDNQDSALGADNITTNNPIEYIAETNSGSGSAMSKHVTIPINIIEPAVGLKVLLSANRPSGSFVDLYYRTLPIGSDDDINTVNYVQASLDTSIGTDDNRDIFREYAYTIGGLGGTLTPFTTFQLKIVFRSTNTSRVPRIKDLRAIALGT